ncbi:hypothetical protein KUTeg_001141 [Tegillarca granosa]|uniref:GH18 domain-containing protein n=1 Tax=Tegillarca granosa TaxID=220873 RepID=A0ABQ9G014_TEGGR|nr:hypothetical protein KUTeg_001141 [Tegillarca granosa]
MRRSYADFVNVMTYDLHGAWDDVTGHNSPLYRGIHEPAGSLLNILIIGFPLYGRGFKLQDRRKTAPGSPSSGGSDKGSYTKEPGYLAYYEVCDIIQNGGSSKWIEDQKVPYLVYNGQWIGYDDARSFREKSTKRSK